MWLNFIGYVDQLPPPPPGPPTYTHSHPPYWSMQKPCPHMVRLLHHYETSTHRIFLLLEYVDSGRLVDFVSCKRKRWARLHEAVTNPPPTSSLIMPDSPKETAQDKIPMIRENETVSKNSGSEGKGNGVLLCMLYTYIHVMCTCVYTCM